MSQRFLKVTFYSEALRPVYVLLYTRRNQDLTLFPEAKTVYTVTRDGADLATVKRIQ